MSSANLIYLDNNATTRLAPESLQAMMACYANVGNPSSKHQAGDCAKEMLRQARSQVAALLNASIPELIFTASGTEANHQAIKGAMTLQSHRRHIVTSQVEHASTLALLRHLESQGVEVTYLGVNSHGQISLNELEAAISGRTALVSLLWANNETGVLTPMADVASICLKHDVWLHTDAVQAVGKVPIDVRDIPVDSLSCSAHKLHGPQGIGALYVRKGHKLPPLMFGHQERGRRGGTENVAGAVGFGVAAELAMRHLAEDDDTMAIMRDHLEKGLLARVPLMRVNGDGSFRVGSTSSLRFGTLDADMILTELDRQGICASAGSACTAGGTEPSHVLLAMGIYGAEALSSVRFSLSRYTTVAEIDHVLEVLPRIVQRLCAEAA